MLFKDLRPGDQFYIKIGDNSRRPAKYLKVYTVQTPEYMNNAVDVQYGLLVGINLEAKVERIIKGGPQ